MQPSIQKSSLLSVVSSSSESRSNQLWRATTTLYVNGEGRKEKRQKRKKRKQRSSITAKLFPFCPLRRRKKHFAQYVSISCLRSCVRSFRHLSSRPLYDLRILRERSHFLLNPDQKMPRPETRDRPHVTECRALPKRKHKRNFHSVIR